MRCCIVFHLVHQYMSYTNVSKFFTLVAAICDDESVYVFVGLMTPHAIQKLVDGAFRAHRVPSTPPPSNTKKDKRERESLLFLPVQLLQ